MRRIMLATSLLMPLAAGTARAETLHYHADLKGGSEVPPNDTTGTGTMDLTIDTATQKIEYALTFAGLTGPATMAHIHGPAAPGKNAGVIVPLGDAPTSPVHGGATLTEAQMKDLGNGLYYANVHTAAHPPGEIRGQLVPAK